MEDHNSVARLVSDLYRHMLADVANEAPFCDANSKEYKRDLDYIQTRFASEGLSFYTVVLPKLGKAIDASLATGSRLAIPVGFKRSRFGYFPQFCWWLFSEVFDEAGYPKPCRVAHSHRPQGDCVGVGLVDNVTARAVRHLRQLCYLAYKLEIPYATELEDKVVSEFVATDRELGSLRLDRDDPFLDLARNIISRVCSGITYTDFHPYHGPGAVATGEEQWEKMRFKRIYAPLQHHFPFTEWCYASVGHLCDSMGELQESELLEAGTAKVVLVPKDSRGPRLISCEPLEYQWVQQAVARPLVREIESHPLTAGRVNFTDQSINRRLAYLGSLGAGWVTLDMKEASDRVSTALVRRLFGGSYLCDVLMACRTSSTRLPNGEVIPLNKFAPMGSALCFPVEALVFWALAVSTLVHSGLYPTVEKAAEYVYVYGDDLVLNAEDYGVVMQYFPTVGLLFNSGKCCTGGSFRESCGMDAFAGVDVTPVKLRTVWSSSGGASVLASYVEYSNSLYERGLYNAARYLQGELDKSFPPVPTVTDREPRGYLCYRRYSIDHKQRGVSFQHRWNFHLHRHEIYATVLHTPLYRRNVPSWEGLFWYLARPSVEVTDRYYSDTPLRPRSLDCRDWRKPIPAVGLVAVRRFPLRRRVTHKRRWCAVQ